MKKKSIKVKIWFKNKFVVKTKLANMPAIRDFSAQNEDWEILKVRQVGK